MEMHEIPLVYSKGIDTAPGKTVYEIVHMWESFRCAQYLGTYAGVNFRSVTCPAIEVGSGDRTVYLRGSDRARDNQRLEVANAYVPDFEYAVLLFNKERIGSIRREQIQISDVIRGHSKTISGVRFALRRTGTDSDGCAVYRKAACRLSPGDYTLGPLVLRICNGGCHPYVESGTLWTNLDVDEDIPVRTSQKIWEKCKQALLEFNQRYSNNKLEMDDVIWDD